MERMRNTPDFSDDKQFANHFYDNVDWRFTRRAIPSQYEKQFEDRYCKLELNEDELRYVGPVLESFAIDAPHYLEITLKGRNPNIYTNIPQGSVWIKMKHLDLNGIEITSDYTVDINSSLTEPVAMYKDVKQKVAPHEMDIYKTETIPLDLDLVDNYYTKMPLDRNERRALNKLIDML